MADDEDAAAAVEAPVEESEDEVRVLSTGLELPLRGLDVGRIWALGEDYAAQAELLVELLDMRQTWPSATQRQIVCDFYMYNLAQAKAFCLTQRQAAVLHAIMAQILQDLRREAAPKDCPCSAKRGLEDFTALLLAHSVSRPPDRLNIFKVSEAKLITDFATATLFKHFSLYQFCINCTQEVQTLRVRRTVQRPLPPPDLSAARPRPRPRGWRTRGKLPGAEDGAGGAAAVDGSAAGEGDAASAGATAARELPEGGAAGEDEAGAAAGEAEEELSPEEQEIKRLVEEKLREKEAELEAKLAAREEAFLARLAAKQQEGGKKK